MIELVASHRSSTTIRTPEELEALLAQVAASSPVWLDLIVAPIIDSPLQNTTLSVAVGRPFSSLTFYDWGPDGDGNRYDSTGTAPEPPDGEDTFDYGGTPTAIQPASAIKVEEARAAAAEFLKTGRRPETVDWTLFEDHEPTDGPQRFGWQEEPEHGENVWRRL